MSCYHPISAMARKVDNSYQLIFTDSTGPVERNGHLYTVPMKVPCGQCIGCRLDYSREWMIRCTLEAEEFPHSSYFVTLTYDDEHLPLNEFTLPESKWKVDHLTGEVFSTDISMTLQPADLTKFMKDLRRYFEYHFEHTGIRFFACGEYGSLNARPHYHLILFNLPLTDLKERGKLRSGFTDFDSKTINDIWSKGRTQVVPYSPACAGYVARYMLKKHKGKDRDAYKNQGLIPEFSRCSRRPGIGAKYYFKNSDRIYSFDHIFINGRQFKPPASFDRLLRMSDEELLSELKDRRREFAINFHPDTDLPEAEYLEVKEKNKLYSVKALPRPC